MFTGLLLALAAGGAGELLPVAQAQDQTAREQAARPLPRVELLLPAGQGRVHHIVVEVAADDAARARGLMFRRELADDAGMLFLWRVPRRVAMWMKNTLIPLDMVFIGADGCVVRVHEGAVPGDLTPIASGAPVMAVLEVKAGMARRLGLRRGVCLKLPQAQASTRRQSTLRGAGGRDR